MTPGVVRLIFMNGDVHEHLVMFMNITEDIDAFMNIPATFMNIKFAKKKSAVGPCEVSDIHEYPVIFMNVSDIH